MATQVLNDQHIDFRELLEHGPQGEGLELLFQQIAESEGMVCSQASRGPDGGRDFIISGLDGDFQKSWLVSCKDYSHSRKSVPDSDLLTLPNECLIHKVDRFLLVTTTLPSSRAEQVLRAHASKGILTRVWNRGHLITLLLKPNNHLIFQAFLPVSYHRQREYVTMRAIDSPLALHPDEIEFEGFCTCGQKSCDGMDGRIYCYWAKDLPEWVKAKRLFWRCYDQVIDCPRCRRFHKRGHVGTEWGCSNPYNAREVELLQNRMMKAEHNAREDLFLTRTDDPLSGI